MMDNYEDWDPMKLTKEQGQSIVYEDCNRFEVIEENMIDNDRWSIQYELIFGDLLTGAHYRTYFNRGATEQQDESPFEYDAPDVQHVVSEYTWQKHWKVVD